MEIFSNLEIFRIFKAQNGLKNIGKHENPSFSDQDAKGFRKLTFGVSKELAGKITSLKGLAGIGGYTVKVFVQK